jgi:tetratricopeptide (TPR) repeat protein
MARPQFCYTPVQGRETNASSWGQIDFKNATPKLSQLEIQSEKNERRFIKLIVGGLVGSVLVIVLVYTGVHFFHRWQERHLVRRAAAYLSGGDVKLAALSARRALQMNPANADAARALAQIADRTGDRAALECWRRVLDLQPNNTEDALSLVRSALRLNDLAAAEKALDGLDEAAKRTAAYHAASGRLAEMKKHPAEAEHHWAEASALAPDNISYQFQLALIRLGSSDQAKREPARQVLERLRADPKQRAASTRALILDGMAHQEEAHRTQLLASELQSYPEALFSDRLLYLEILRKVRDPGFAEYLGKLQKDAASNPADLASLLSWMSGHENAAAAIEFAKTLPAQSVGKWPVAPALAAAYASVPDWPGLEQLTSTTEWPPFDFLRHAYLCRALRGQNKKLPAEQEWIAAQKEASTQPQSLLILARSAAAWGWEAETVDLLWVLTKSEDTKLEALQTLYQHYAKLGDTTGLYRTLLRLVEVLPHDLALQNNLAQISLLIGADVERARKVAAETRSKEPRNGAYVATYAFSLYTSGDVKGALQTMDQLTPDQLRDPSVAVYYGVVLAAAGQKEKAREYLQRAAKATLLPEEKALVEKAENTLR